MLMKKLWNVQLRHGGIIKYSTGLRNRFHRTRG